MPPITKQKGEIIMTFQEYKEALCKEIYTVDVCHGNKKLADSSFKFENCMRPPFGYADILYLVATSPNELYLERRLQNYQGYSKWLEQQKGE